MRYRVYPGHGAPLDHPIPITELAFRGTGAPPAVERMVTLLDLLADMSKRGLDDPDDHGSDDDEPDEAEPDAPVADAFVSGLFDRLDALAGGDVADLSCVYDDVLPLVIADPAGAARLLSPMVDAVRAAIAEQTRVIGDAGEPPLELVALIHLANALDCVGCEVGDDTMNGLHAWLLRLDVSRHDEAGAHYWTTGFAALALNHRSAYRARAGQAHDGADPLEFTANETFGDNLEGYLAHLAGAKETGAGLADVLPAWHDTVERFSALATAHTLDVGALLWMARVVHHDIGSGELGTVAEYLRATLAEHGA